MLYRLTELWVCTQFKRCFRRLHVWLCHLSFCCVVSSELALVIERFDRNYSEIKLFKYHTPSKRKVSAWVQSHSLHTLIWMALTSNLHIPISEGHFQNTENPIWHSPVGVKIIILTTVWWSQLFDLLVSEFLVIAGKLSLRVSATVLVSEWLSSFAFGSHVLLQVYFPANRWNIQVARQAYLLRRMQGSGRFGRTSTARKLEWA